jgi:hypothetical protein
MLLAMALWAVLFAGAGAAQERPGPAAEFAAGALMFADDGIVTEGFAGGTARFYLLPRISVGPEISFVQGRNHRHVMLTGNVTFDFLGPVNGRPRAVTPYAVGGGGIFWTREPFPNEVFWSSDPSFTVGGGVRALAGEHVVFGAEARLGWEAHIRLNGFVGVRFL